MKKAMLLRVLIPFALSAVLLILLVKNVWGEAGQIGDAVGAADWRLIPVAIGLYFLAVWLRSVRWGLLLPEHAVNTLTLFRALVVGFTVNDLLPLRVGEVARAYLIARWCSIPYGTTMASLVVERVLDGLSLAVLLLIALTLVPAAPGYLLVVGVLAAAIFVTCAALVALGAWRASTIMAVAGGVARLLPPRFGDVIKGLADNFARSLALVHSPGRLARLLGLSLLAWCLELSLFFVLLLAFRLPATYPLALLVGSAANFATLVPSSPGYAGTFDAVLIKVLQDVAQIGAVPAFSYDVVVHWVVLYIPVVVVGTLVLWRSHMTFGQITHAPDRLAAPRARDERQAA
ncbi:MAG: flippase-like domain-containing protein [Chloroflexi bacterium]|nr:flippase-like domain-containing protein [Chloroflexota bacterium]